MNDDGRIIYLNIWCDRTRLQRIEWERVSVSGARARVSEIDLKTCMNEKLIHTVYRCHSNRLKMNGVYEKPLQILWCALLFSMWFSHLSRPTTHPSTEPVVVLTIVFVILWTEENCILQNKYRLKFSVRFSFVYVWVFFSLLFSFQ